LIFWGKRTKAELHGIEAGDAGKTAGANPRIVTFNLTGSTRVNAGKAAGANPRIVTFNLTGSTRVNAGKAAGANPRIVTFSLRGYLSRSLIDEFALFDDWLLD